MQGFSIRRRGLISREMNSVQQHGTFGIVATMATMLLIATAAAGQVLSVRHLAGPLDGMGSRDGVGSAAKFLGPRRVAVNAAGTTVYVADSFNYTIRRIDVATQTVTTLAGRVGYSGTVDGVGSAARFGGLGGVVVDAAGTTVYVADSANNTIRRIDVATQTVTTFAGFAGQVGSADGVGSAARFDFPVGVAMDSAGTTIYVTDRHNDTIRRIDVATRTVTTLAGLAGNPGNVDGVGSAARFSEPGGVAVDAAGTMVYVADSSNHTIRRINAATRSVTTVAGLAGQAGSADGVGSAARFYYPEDVAVDTAGTALYIADLSNHTIRRIDVATQAVTTLAGLAGQVGSADGIGSAARFFFPAGVAVDAAGTTVHVADSSNYRIRSIDVATRAVTTLAGSSSQPGATDGVGSAARFSDPNGIAVDAAGTTAYVADFSNHTIRRIDVATQAVTTLAGLPGQGGSADGVGSAARFLFPADVAVDAAGTTVFAADTSNYTIRRIDVATQTVTTIAGLAGNLGSADGAGSAARFSQPRGVAVNAAGTTVYVADSLNHTIRRIDVATRAVTTLAGLAGNPGSVDGVGSAARFNGPERVVVDAAGTTVYVTDRYNHTIRRIDVATRTVTTVAGLAGNSGSVDGVGSLARFSQPTGVAVDAAGTTLYAADTSNYTIRRIDVATGTVTTVAGLAGTPGTEDGVGRGARLAYPLGVAVNAVGRRLFIVDQVGLAIREAVPVGGEAGDYDRDGWSDVAVYRPSSGTWFSLDSSTDNQTYRFHGWGVQAQADTPAPGDYDGDGVIDPTVYRPASGTWFILTSSSNYTDWAWFGWGNASDTPMQGDYDGDGKTDAAVYRPSTGEWFVRPSSGATQWSVVFGQAGDVPIAGDFDGDGRRDIAVYRPSSGTWFILKSSSNFTAWTYRGWGVQAQGDVPAPGDYDGDGKTDPCVFRPASGTWFILESHAAYTTWAWFGWGTATDTLVPADYDGDGKTDAAVYRPSTGEWFVRPSSGATQWSVVFGQAADVPLQGIR